MKTKNKSFLFFYLIFFSSPFVVDLHSQDPIDSISYYHDLSKKKNIDFIKQISYIDRAILLANRYEKTKLKLNSLNRKSFLYSKNGDFKNAIIYANLLLTESVKARDSLKILTAYRKLADYSRRSDKFLNAFNFYTKHKELNVKSADTVEIIRDLRFIASVQYKLGLLYDSESTVIEALELSNNYKQLSANTRVGLYNHLGIVYRKLNNYERALELYERALGITKSLDEKNLLLNNKANVYSDQKKYASALIELKKVYKNTRKQNDEIKLARALGNLGYVQSKLNQPEALPNMLKALKLKIKNDYKSSVFNSYINIAEYFKDRKNYKEADKYAKKAYNMNLNPHQKVEALTYLLDFLNNPKIIEYQKLTDSISKARLVQENKYVSMKYDYKEKEEEVHEIRAKFLNAELQKSKERERKIIYMFLGGFLILFSTLIFIKLKQRHKKEKLKEVYATETRISRKVHDELANDVYNIMNRIQNESQTKQKVILEQLEAVYKKTRDISYENSTINLENNYYNLELKEILSSYQSKKISILTKGLHEKLWFDIKDHIKIVIERVLKELMINMKKHSKASNVAITFKKDKKNLLITYVDDGVGLKKAGNFKKNGLQNAENRIQNINGTFTFDMNTKNGVKLKISIPV